MSDPGIVGARLARVNLPANQPVNLIEVACGRGAGHGGPYDAPAILDGAGLGVAIAARGHALRRFHVSPAAGRDSGISAIAAVGAVCRELADHTEESTRRGEWFLALGGDHSIAAGTWAGAATGLRDRGGLGLVWVDAHMDAHTIETTYTGNVHGMPLAALLGYGAPTLVRLARPIPALDPRHVCLVGVRSFEPEEAALLARLGVRVILMSEVERMGIESALDQACAIARRGTAGFGLSLDIDVVDPADAPGVGTPEPDGIAAAAMLRALDRVTGLPGYVGAELVEFNPVLDRDGRTAQLARDLALACLPKPRANPR